MSEDTLPVFERFFSFQGEGVHMGRSAFFIRTFGCPVKCPWCDSAGTWHKDYVPSHIEKMSPFTLADEAYASGAEIVVVTGGEPTIHSLSLLTEALKARAIPSHLETSGCFPIQGRFDWVTLSPKKWKLPLVQNLQIADEFKFIIEAPEDIEFYWKVLGSCSERGGIDSNVWLHPEWSQRGNENVLRAICEAVKEYPGRYRAGWQLHKLYQVDRGDVRSRPMVPLGGDLRKGF